MELALDNQCHASSKQSGNRCRKKAEPGQSVCRFHGGASPQARSKALERLITTRDLALDQLMIHLEDHGDRIDPKTLLDVITKLNRDIELLEGRATERKESIRVDSEEVRDKVLAKLDQLAQTQARRPEVLEMVKSMADAPKRRVHHG